MCGIAGILQSKLDAQAIRAQIESMRDALAHRGPNDKGTWIDDKNGGVALGHRRLSVIDLSPLGAQPMASVDGRYVIVFNGEIYNFLHLRAELETLGHEFQGGSDTEVALGCFLEWGIETALQRFEGMFAIALWDKRDQCLYLARDRFGEKPLYYGAANGVFIFASELKALRAHPSFSSQINRQALSLLLRHTYIPSPHCIFSHYQKLQPATWIRIDRDLNSRGPQNYWNLERFTRIPDEQISDSEALQELETLISQSVREKMVADVPVGAFLSGGVDSSLVVALMRKYSSSPVNTFSIGFDDVELNEAHQAEQTAKYLGTSHTELYVTEKDLLSVVPDIPKIYDEPFADPSQIPTVLVSRLAREKVTVALTGDGGDELFAGYDRYPSTLAKWERTSRSSAFSRRVRASFLLHIKARLDSKAAKKYHKKGQMQLAAGDLRKFYRNQMSYWTYPESIVAADGEPVTQFMRGSRGQAQSDPWQWLTMTDALCYLPDDIMVKVDRAGMSVGLETRAPFLDSRLAAFALALPLRMHYRGGVQKWLLRQMLGEMLPGEAMDRSKRGFGVPLDSWLRGPLREWANELLKPSRLRGEGYFDQSEITEIWDSHLNNRADQMWPLWPVLMFQSWLEDSSRHA